jgi:UDP-N-acetylglucosamine--N-acetylmuramyl-(pentapeptide) pyrophosphoryl-undecaprenol N-acetylglucosamine transferase
MLRILFTGGGTGGHIYPILAVAEELKSLEKTVGIEIDLRYIGSPDRFGTVLENNGIKVDKIFSAKLRRYFDLRNILDFLKLPVSFFQAFWKLFWMMPDVLFSKGGPGALPIVLAARLYRIPVVIHESDSVPGLANRLSAKFASRVAVSFASAAKLLNNKNIALVGNPIRRELLEQGTAPAEAKKNFGFSPDAPLILVIGGSQGSTRINNFFLDIAGELIKNYQILHQTGLKNFDEIKKELDVVLKNLSAEEKARYKIAPYFEENIKDAYSAADLIVSRAGSGSIFEIAAMGKPSVLIPLPEAAHNHQSLNAFEYAKGVLPVWQGAALVLEEENFKPNILLDQLRRLFGEPGRLASMSQAAKNFSKPEAAKTIAEEILNLTKIY